MINATELMVFLSDGNAMSTRVDDLADLVRRGFVELTYADDAVTSLSTTPLAPRLAVMPAAIS